MLEPWTQTIDLRWRPELRFYEERVALLRELDDQRQLKAFRVHEDRVDAQLVDVYNQLSVRQNGLTLHLLRPDADPSLAWTAAEIALRFVRPEYPREVLVGYQYLVQLATSFEEGVARSFERLFSGLFPVGSGGFDDCALLVDFHTGGERLAIGQLEFGIVRRDEVPVRLARSVGRLRAEHRRSDPELWELEEFPSVSLFCDSAVTTPADQGVQPLDQARAFWESSREEVGRFVLDLHARLDSADEDEQGGEARSEQRSRT